MTTQFPAGFSVPEAKRIRLIVNTDAKNEADDQYAIVHALLTPKFGIEGFVASHFGSDKSPTSMQDSYGEIKKLLAMMDRDVPVLKGATAAVNRIGDDSEGSDFIIAQAFRDDPKRLFCVFMGPLTDMALAIRKRPDIVGQRVTVVWIGGGAYPDGGWEYNLLNDIEAANEVFASGIDLWQVPRNVYSLVLVSVAELEARVADKGRIGRYLVDQLLAVNEQYGNNPSWPSGESWCLGDSAAVGLLMDSHDFHYDTVPAPIIDGDMKYAGRNEHAIRAYRYVDSRFILEDFYAKLALFQRSGGK